MGAAPMWWQPPPTGTWDILVQGAKTKAGPSWSFPACCVGKKAFRAVMNSPGASGQHGRNSLCCLRGWWHLPTRRCLTLACTGWPTSRLILTHSYNPFSAVGKAIYKTCSFCQRSRKGDGKHLGWLQVCPVQVPSWFWCHQVALGVCPRQQPLPKSHPLPWKMGTNSGSDESINYSLH